MERFRHFRILFVMLGLSLFLGACRSEEVVRLEQYHAEMDRFFENISAYHNSINAIESSADAYGASEELLRLLDGLAQEFSDLRTIPIPSEFSAISDLMLDASDSMEQAVKLYHEAYDDGYRAVKA